ncbi:MAG: SDR family NAD(P)-dependent oxidoreductase [Gemmatimonadota bacterium]
MTPLRGRHAFITGANRGIGAAITRHLVQAGADLTLCVRTPASADALVHELSALGPRMRVVQARRSAAAPRPRRSPRSTS